MTHERNPEGWDEAVKIATRRYVNRVRKETTNPANSSTASEGVELCLTLAQAVDNMLDGITHDQAIYYRGKYLRISSHIFPWSVQVHVLTDHTGQRVAMKRSEETSS